MAKHQSARTATPRLRFPEFRDAAAWEAKTLLSASQRITQGGTPDTAVPNYWDGEVAWITPAEMGKSDDPHVASTARRITEAGLQACSSELLPVRSVIISTRAPIGHLAINTVPMAINQGCKGIVPGPALDHQFLFASLFLAKRRLTDLGAGNTFKELSASALKSFKIALPTRAEQQKIADCLTSLDEVIAAQGRKVEALKAHKRGLMQQLFPREGETRPRLRFPEFRNAPEWYEKPVSAVTSTVAPPQKIATSGYQQQGRLAIVDQSPDPVCGWTDDLSARVNAPLPLIVFGDHTCVLKLIDHDFAQGADGIKIISARSCIDVRFLFYALQADPVASTSYRRHFSLLQEKQVRFPEDANEQQRITDCLSSLDTRITAETAHLAALKTHKQGLMQQLFPAQEAQGA